MLLLYYYYIIIIFLLYYYYILILILCYFFRKKVTKKPEVFAIPLCARDISPHCILSCADYISPTHLFVSFDHTQSPHNLCLILFFFYIVLFYDFFHIPSIVVPSKTFSPLYFSFFCFSTARSFSFSSGEIHQSTILLRVSQRYVSLFE